MRFAPSSRAVRGHALVVFIAVIALHVAPAAAQERLASSGFYVDVGAGGTTFLGDASDYSAIGPSFELRVGYDLFSWVSLGGYAGASTHEATVPPPPEGEYYQLYSAGGDARLGFRLGPLGLFVDGGVGVSMISSNILTRVDILEPGERFSLQVRAGAGLEYQVLNRHYAFGLAGQWMSMTQFDATQGIAARLYMRYTY